jgi:hypothetical protein
LPINSNEYATSTTTPIVDNSEEIFPKWESIIKKIDEIWEKSFQRTIPHLKPDEIDQYFAKFKSYIMNVFQKKSDFNNWKPYYQTVINFQIEMIQFQTQIETNQINNKENDGIDNSTYLKRPKRRSSVAGATATVPNQSIHNQSINNKSISKEDDKKSFYDINHMVRCHSIDNNPRDDKTVVNSILFLDNNIAATCGGSIINLIDIKNGKITQRFNDDEIIKNNKEVYKTMATSNLNGVNPILIAGGNHGRLKVILPQISCCISRFNAHNECSVDFLLFHRKYSDILFSASASNDSSCIKIWRLQIEGTIGDESDQFDFKNE